MREFRVARALQFRNDPLRQHLAQLHAPLVERIDFQMAPWVKTECSYRAISLPSIAGVSRQPESCSKAGCLQRRDEGPASPAYLPLDLLRRLAESERFGLREDIRHQNIVMMAERIQRLAECDEVTGNKP